MDFGLIISIVCVIGLIILVSAALSWLFETSMETHAAAQQEHANHVAEMKKINDAIAKVKRETHELKMKEKERNQPRNPVRTLDRRIYPGTAVTLTDCNGETFNGFYESGSIAPYASENSYNIYTIYEGENSPTRRRFRTEGRLTLRTR